MADVLAAEQVEWGELEVEVEVEVEAEDQVEVDH